MHVHRAKAGAPERGGHFPLTVHPLLAQDGHAGLGTARQGARGASDAGLAQEETGGFAIENANEFLARAVRIIPQALQVMRRRRPFGQQLKQIGLKHGLPGIKDSNLGLFGHHAQQMHALGKTGVMA